MPNFKIRVMQRAELDKAIAWAAAEGWNPGLHDAHCYYHADPNGFLVGLLDGEMIASISAIKYSPEFGFIGFYLVKPEFRSQGYGIALWQAALAYLNGCNIGLDGVSEQQANYRKSGFNLAYANARYKGVVSQSCETFSSVSSDVKEQNILPLSQLTFEQIAQYEKAFFPCERHSFLKQWIKQENSLSLAYMQEGELVGYGVMRQCQEGYKLAPLFANSCDIAKKLMAAFISKLDDGDEYFLDVPMCHKKAVELATMLAMEPVFETARMYTKGIPVLPLERIYGVTSFEIG